MTIINLINPMVALPENYRRIIDQRIIEKHTPGAKKTISERERIKASEGVGMLVAQKLLQPLRATHEVTDMNAIQTNFRGYDILIHEKGSIARPCPRGGRDPNIGLKIQVKGSVHPDWCGWQHRVGKASSRDYDIVLLIDAGLCTTARMSYFRDFPCKDSVDIYVLPKHVVDQQIDLRAQAHRKMQFVSYWRPPLAREQSIQFHALPDYSDRFDLIVAALPLP